MIDYGAMTQSTVRDLKEARRDLTREINRLEQAAVIFAMPELKVTYNLTKWQAKEEQTDKVTVWGQLLGLSRTNLQLRETETGRIRWIKLRRIVSINDIRRLDVDDMTVSEIREATGV